MNKTLIATLALGLSLAMAPTFGADAPVKKAYKYPLTGKPSMAVEGRFHKLHEKQELLDCADCHDKEQEDILYLRKDDRMSPKLAEQGQVGRKQCLTCHKPGYVPNLPRSFWGV